MDKGEINKQHDGTETLEMFRDAIDSLTEGFALFDKDRRLVIFNQAHYEMSRPLEYLLQPGITREQILKEDAKHGFYNEIIGREAEWISEYLAYNESFTQGIEMTKPDGTCHLISTYPTKLGGLVLTRRDITEKKRIETEKRDSEILVRTVLETSPAATVMARKRDGKIIYLSPAAIDLFGQMEFAIEHYVTSDDREELVKSLERHGKIDGYRVDFVGHGGKVFPANVSARVADYKGEKVIISTVADLSQQFEAELLIQKVLDTSSAIVTMVRVEDNQILYRSPEAAKLFGDTKIAIEHYANPDQSLDYVKLILSQGEVEDYRLELISAGGDRIYTSNSGRLAEYNGEKVIVSSIVDLTKQHEADILVRTVLDASSAIITMVGIDDGEIRYRTPAALKMFGDAKTAAESYVYPEKRADFLKVLKAQGFVDNFEVEFLDAEGKPFPASISSRIIEYNGEKVMVTTLVDLTKQNETDALIRKVMEACPVPVQMTRADNGEMLYRSKETIALFGDIENSRKYYANPKVRENYINDLRKSGSVKNWKTELVNSDGKQFWGEISSKLIDFNGIEAIVSNTRDLTDQIETEEFIGQVLEACQVPIQVTSVETGDVLFSTSETINLFGDVKNSREYYLDDEERPKLLEELRETGFYKDRIAQYKGADGRVFWSKQSARIMEFKGEEVIVSNTWDLTEELAMQEELKNQRDMLFQNEKMSALGELLAGVAHELNNPLSIVVGHSHMLREEAEDPDVIRRIEKISAAADRCAKIVKTFLAMARQQPTKMERANINSVVSTAVDVAGYGSSNDELEIKYDLDEKIPEIVADADQITQVIINLIINAEQAIANSGVGNQIKVSTRVGKTSKAGEYVKIIIKDNGPGIPDSIKPRIFEPFFTTKEVGDGTGIGLAFCHRLILSHGGQIWLDKNYKNGSKFSIRLPVSKIEETAEESVGGISKAAEKGMALVVDDEPDVAELISEVLKKDGFQVDVANSGSEAVRYLQAAEYDLLLSDLNMPEMDGRRLYEVLKTKYPKILQVTGFITGDTLGNSSRTLLQESKCPYLEKPVSPDGLRNLINEIFNQEEIENK